MATSEVLDEILALKSIFCNPGEFYLINPSSLEDIEEPQGPISFKIAVKCDPQQDLTSVANCHVQFYCRNDCFITARLSWNVT